MEKHVANIRSGALAVLMNLCETINFPTARRASIVAVAILATCLIGCRSTATVVRMGSSIARYDHNRSCQLTAQAINQGRPTPIDTELYVMCPETRHCGPDDPACCSTEITITGEVPAADGWCDVQLMPVFTGMALPLSDDTEPCARSDRSDLISYLARGPLAGHGIEIGNTQGDVPSTESSYGGVLEILESEEELSRNAIDLNERLKSQRYKTTTLISDARYPRASFADVLAFRHLDFWFVLYRLPSRDQFSRLVVVPTEATAQKRKAKTPAGRGQK